MKKIILGGIIILIIFGLYLTYDQITINNQRQRNIERATINLLKASLDFYYFKEGHYPWKILGLKESLENNEQGSYENLEKGIGALKDFKYLVRQDEKAYRISFIDLTGEVVNIEGEYSKDFHEYND